jgi:hypothetical protein
MGFVCGRRRDVGLSTESARGESSEVHFFRPRTLKGKKGVLKLALLASDGLVSLPFCAQILSRASLKLARVALCSHLPRGSISKLQNGSTFCLSPSQLQPCAMPWPPSPRFSSSRISLARLRRFALMCFQQRPNELLLRGSNDY